MHTIALKIPPKIDVFSDDELYEFCRQNSDLRIERDENGQIFIKMPTGTQTSIYNSELLAEVIFWNRKSKTGKVTDADGGYTLPDGSMRVPDVAWISHTRLSTVSEKDLKKFAPVCPDFVIELRSESDTLPELKEKMGKWLKNGVRLGWLIDPNDQKVYVYEPEKEAIEKTFADILSGDDVLPGFTLRIQDIVG